jgi:hypothetical protein
MSIQELNSLTTLVFEALGDGMSGVGWSFRTFIGSTYENHLPRHPVPNYDRKPVVFGVYRSKNNPKSGPVDVKLAPPLGRK